MTNTNHKKINKWKKTPEELNDSTRSGWSSPYASGNTKVGTTLKQEFERMFAPTGKEGWENWEREFDEQFSVFDGSQKIVRHVTYSSWVKDFISQLLLQQKSELIKEIENILKDCTDAFGTTDYKMFAEKVISLPKRMKPKTTRTTSHKPKTISTVKGEIKYKIQK